jgi:hypothetical protein
MAVYGEVAASVPQGLARAGAIVNYGGAVVSLALIVGIGVWGYKLVMRDVTGIPVVRAMEGPMRSAPSDPGGDVALHAGLSVNAVAAMGEAAPPEDVLVLAPRQVDLSAEDLAVQADAEQGEVLAVSDVGFSPVGLTEPTTPTGPLTADQVLALADQIAATAAPLSELAAGTDTPVAMSVNGVDAAAIADMVPASVPGVSTSLRPSIRPNDAVASVATPMVAPLVAPVAEVTTAAIAAGTALVQLGAFESPAIAGLEWQRLGVKFAEYMTEKQQIIQQAESGGKTFFRLRASGFADLSEARRFCSALVAESAACIPVVTR